MYTRSVFVMVLAAMWWHPGNTQFPSHLNCIWHSCFGDWPGSDHPCRCDPLCNTYSDCCLDSPYYDRNQQRKTSNDYKCQYVYYHHVNVYMKDKCMEGWRDTQVQEMCLSSYKHSDPLTLIPVTSTNTGHTYHNYFCAICNEDSLALRIWNVKLFCDIPLDYSLINASTVLDNLIFRKNEWGVLLRHAKDHFHQRYYPCSLYPEPPYGKAYPRRCSHAIKTCAVDWNNEEVALQCQSYKAVVYTDGEFYNNPHCAICNWKKYFDCGGEFSPYIPRPQGFPYLLDINDRSGSNLVGSKVPCSSRQIWDPFLKNCRNVTCPKPDEDYRYGKCTPVKNVGATAHRQPISDRSNIISLNTTSNANNSNATTPDSSTSIPEERKIPHISTSAPRTPTHPTSIFLSSNDATPDGRYVSSSNTCYRVTLAEEEFVRLPNGTVYVEAYGRMYSEGEYKETEEGVLVCLPDTSSRKFSVVLGWVTLAGLVLSCTGLLLHLTAFILLPNLRNLSGKNLASLCLALLAAYITFLVNMLSRPRYAGCVTLAAAMYYFFVSSFTWMNAIAFDMWYTFYVTKRKLRVAKGAQWHRFLAYSLYSWLLPAAALLTLVLVDQLEPHGVPEQFLPRLGLSWCWFSHRKALLVFFAAPMVVIIIINSVLFISTAFVIASTTSTTTGVVSGGAKHRDQFKMYLRLAVLMGFTWISGITAAYLDLEALWYIFVVLNTLQGVSIFLAFTWRTKVWRDVGVTCRRALQRRVSIVTRRPLPPDTRGKEMNHTSEQHSPPGEGLTLLE